MRYPAFRTFLLAFAVCAAPVSAQETFAPLITENTALYVHVDFRKIEIDTIKQSWTKYAEELLQSLRFDEASTRSTLSAINKDFDKLGEFIRPTFETITQKLGLREVALIIDTDYESDTIPLIIAVPWKGKTNNDFLVLEELLAEAPFLLDFLEGLEYALVPKGDFLFLAPGDVEALVEWFDALKSSEAGIMQAMKTLGDDAHKNDRVKIALSMTDKLRERLLEELQENDAFPEPVLNILTYIARKVDWAAASFPNPLMAEKHPPYTMTVKTSTATDARQLRAMLQTGIDIAITALQGSVAMYRTLDVSMPEMPQTVYEFSRGYLRTMLPIAEGDKLVFHQPESDPLMELYVKMSYIGFLYSAFEMARWELCHRATACENNLKQIGISLHNYHDVHNAFPPLYTVDANGKPLHSWRVLILPFIEQSVLYEAIRLNEPWDSEHNKQFHNRVIPQYVCPKNEIEGDKNCHYSVIVSDGGRPITGGSFVPAANEKTMTGSALYQITDGTSNTLAVVEVKEGFCWMDPTADITFEEFLKGINGKGRVGSNHRGGANGLLFDAVVRFLPDDIPAETLRALGTPNGGELFRD